MLAAPPSPPDAGRGAGAGPRQTARLDLRVTSAVRLVFATVGPLVYTFDPPQVAPPARDPAFIALVAFLVWASVVHALTAAGRLARTRWVPWVDLGWLTLLVALDAEASSIFHPLYLFAILCAALQGGLRGGLTATAASFVSFAFAGGLTLPGGPALDLEHALVRPLYLSVLGSLVSVLGAHELRLRSRLAFLTEAVSLANPRFGAGHLLARLVASVRAFFRADACRLVVREARGDCWMRTAVRGADPAGGAPTPIPEAIAAVLLPEPATSAFLCRGPRWPRPRGAPAVDVLILAAGRAFVRCEPCARCEAVARTLEARSFVSVPFPAGEGAAGRLYVTSSRWRAFAPSDVRFLLQVMEQAAPMIEKVRLVDRLATDAADEERLRIARDLHDAVVQPWIGFSLGLAGVRGALERGRTAEASTLIDRLARVAHEEADRLRTYARSLRAGTALEGDLLTSAVGRFCSRFSSATGISVDVVTEGVVQVEPRVAGEVFQLVAEALSNVRRHTEAAAAHVRIAARDDRLVVQVDNDSGPVPTPVPRFSPRSLSERAAAVGGRVEVDCAAPDHTTVRIEIPL